MTTGTKLHGFTVTRVRGVQGQSGTLIEMTHDKSGARLCLMQSDEINKLFSIAFKTPPKDSTGVFHILEHSVLCGSEAFPVKEPFVDLLKSSMNTFLNAMTFPDKTMYPVSSRNERDFLNLTRVYLDAVFAPRIAVKPDIFYQEGWHVELSEAGDPSYKGVVLNEMKGAMASVDDMEEAGMNRALFPDNCYAFNSGGDPEHVPDLSYETFLATYREHYHPSNAYIWLDGNIPLDETLSLIDSYLSRYERLETRHDIALQKALPLRECAQEYELSAGEDDARKAYFTLGKIVCTWQDKETALATNVLCDVLTGSNEAPLKRALLESGLCQDAVMSLADGIAQTTFKLRLQNIDDDKRTEALAIIRDTVRTLVQTGMDKNSVEASINRLEFRFKEPQEPQGLIRNIYALETWLYGGDPIANLSWDDAFAALREKLSTRYFEELLYQLFSDDGLVLLRTLPSRTLGDDMRAKEAARLRRYLDACTEDEVRGIRTMNAKLVAWQQSQDSPEALATLPMLDISEISPLPERMETHTETVLGAQTLAHRAPCDGIAHLSLYFRATDYSLEELTALSLLGKLLCELPTSRRGALELQQAIKTNLGRMDFSVTQFSGHEDAQSCAPFFVACVSVLTSKLEIAEELLCEVLTETVFDQKERVREIVLQAEEQMKQAFLQQGVYCAMLRALARGSAGGAVDEAIGGYTKLAWLHAFAKDFDRQYDALLALLARFRRDTLCRERLTVSVTSAQDVSPRGVIARFPMGAPVAQSARYTSPVPGKTGVRTPAQVSDTAMASCPRKNGKQYDGSANVLSNILSLASLWSKVRVQGGAYGASISISRLGQIFCYSYCDPNAARTLSVYRELAEDTRAFAQSDEDLDRYIISTIAQSEPLLTPMQKGRLADKRYFSGVTWDMRCQTRREMLETTKAALLSWADALCKMRDESDVCVLGPASAIEACMDENLTLCDL